MEVTLHLNLTCCKSFRVGFVSPVSRISLPHHLYHRYSWNKIYLSLISPCRCVWLNQKKFRSKNIGTSYFFLSAVAVLVFVYDQYPWCTSSRPICKLSALILTSGFQKMDLSNGNIKNITAMKTAFSIPHNSTVENYLKYVYIFTYFLGLDKQRNLVHIYNKFESSVIITRSHH